MKKLLLIFLFSCGGLAIAEEIHLSDLSGGMYSYPSPNKIPDTGAALIQNFFTDIQPMAVERNGSTVLDSNVGSNSKSISGLWRFVDISGNEWIIEYSSRTYYKHVSGNNPVAFGYGTTTGNIPRAATNLGKIMFVDGVDAAWTFDGTTSSQIANAPIGSLIIAWRTRFVIANVLGGQSTVRFSRDGDETTWALGPLATDPFSIQIGGANDGYPIRCLGNYEDYLIIQRKYDTWAASGFSQSDIQNRNVSTEIGCIEPGTAREFDGSYLFLSWRGLEEMVGNVIHMVSEPIRNITDVLVKNTANQRSNIQTTQVDWQAGTVAPVGSLSTTAVVGSLTLSTMTAQTLADNTTAQFVQGTLTNFSTTTQLSPLFYVKLATGPQYACQTGAVQTGGGCGCNFIQTFTAPYDFIMSSVTIRLSRDSSMNANATLLLQSTNNVTLATLGTLVMSGVPVTPSLADVTFITTTTAFALKASTRYQLVLQGSGCFNQCSLGACCSSSSNQIYGYTNLTPCNTSGELFDGVSTQELNFSITGFNNISTATILSRTFDVGFTTQTWLWLWGPLQSNYVLSAGSTLTFQTQSSNDGSTFDTLTTVPVNVVTTTTVRRFLRYQMTATSTAPTASIRISSVSLTAGPFISTGGAFTSQLLSIGNAITAWGPVSIQDIKSSGTITYQFGSTTTASIAAITNWIPIVNGGVPSVSTGPYAAFKSSFTPIDGNSNLVLGEFDTSWTEGGTIPAPISINYDRRYWISLTTTSGASPTQDTVYVYQRNRTWISLKGLNAASFTLWRDQLMFGDSTASGNVYQFDTGNADNGNSITSTIITKSYDAGQHYRDKDWRRSYLTFYGGLTGAFSLGFINEQSTSTYSLGTANMPDGTGQVFEKYSFPLNGTVPLQGRELQYVLTKSGTGDRLKLFDISLDYMVKEAR